MPVWLLWIWSHRKLVGIILAAVFLFTAGYETRVKLDDAKEARELAAGIEAQKEAQAASNAKATAWEKQLAEMRLQNRKLTRRLLDETKAPIYSSCIVPDGGVRLYNETLSGRAAGRSDN